MCPACGQPMFAYQWEAVEIDRCPRCRGVWLDTGELETLLDQAGLDHGRLMDVLAGAPDGPRSRRRCPRCPRRLRAFTAATDPALELDRCPRGHGLWLDHGEIDTLVRSFFTGEEGALSRLLKEMFHDGAAPAPGR